MSSRGASYVPLNNNQRDEFLHELDYRPYSLRGIWDKARRGVNRFRAV